MRRIQQGQIFGWLLVLILLVGAVLQLARIVPHYLDHRTLRHVLEDMVADEQFAVAGPERFRRELAERMRRNGVRRIDLEQAVRVEQRAGGLRVQVAYEGREPLFGNLVLVMEFEERLDSR